MTELIRRKQERWSAGQKKRVALLLRVSDKKQTKDDQDVPIPVQRDYCLKLVAKHSDEWEIATHNGEPIEYTEAGVSGFKLSKDDREILTNAMVDAADDRFDILVIYKTDRLSRNSEEYPIIIRQFAQMGVEIWVYETGTPLKSSTQVDKLLRFVEGWQAETESVNTRVRVTNAMKRMAENGAWTGGKTSYGYRLKDFSAVEHVDANGKVKKRPVRGIEVEEEEAKWVRLMFDLYVNQGLGGTQIARLINSPPYMARKRNGQPWDGPQILEILKNPIYMGRPAWGKNSYQTGRRVRKTSDEWTWSEVHVPEWELVHEATWHKAQKLRAERFGEVSKGKRKTPPRSFTSHLLLTGVAFCGFCGQPLVTKTYSNKRTKADGTVVHDKYEGYMCRNHKRGAQSSCGGTKGYWRKDLIEDAVLNIVDQWFGQFDFEQVKAKVAESYQASATQAESGLEALKEEVESLTAQRTYYTDQLNLAITGKKTRIPLNIIEEQLTEIEEKLTTAEAQLRELDQHRSAKMVEEDTLHRLSEILPHWATAFKNAPAHQRKFLLNQVVERVNVFDDTMEVAVNVKIKAIVEAASAAETETASTLEGAFTRGPQYVHRGKYRGPADV
ncbi:MAG: Resolvase domain protein [Symbiobacteriaceae bacterium]|nr:Resolvase domain protein [Symbiobacteriaceae bacterium]